MQGQARTASRGAVGAAIVGSFLASGVLVWGATRAALDAPPTAQAAGQRVRLPATSGVARTRLDVPAMIPGDSFAGCVELDLPSRVGRGTDVRVHGSSSGGLSDHLRLTVRHGAPGSSCTSPGELANVMAGRIANLFNFHGPNYVVDAACASAMAAITAACEGLE